MAPQFLYISGQIPVVIPGDSVWSWGKNDNFQLGRDPVGNAAINLENFDDAVLDLECGSSYSYIIKADGTLWAAGLTGAAYTFGDGSTSSTGNAFVQIGTATDWVKIGGKRSTHHFIKSDGRLFGHGENSNLELGNGASTDTNTIALIDSGNWIDVAADVRGGVGIKSSGRLYAWGRGEDPYAVGDGSDVDRSSPVQLGVATTWVKCVMGFSARFALRSNGDLYAWGRQVGGELGLGLGTGAATVTTPTLIGTGYADIDAGSFSVIATKTDGTLYEWGFTDRLGVSGFYDTPQQIGTDTDWVNCFVGVHTQSTNRWLAAATKDTEQLYMWGYNFHRQMAIADTTSGLRHDVTLVQDGIQNFTWSKVAISEAHAIALTKQENPP